MVRIIKLSSGAVAELLAEVFERNYEEIMQLEGKKYKEQALQFLLTKEGEFLFVSQDYDEQINLTSDHDGKILGKLAYTTDTMLTTEKKFIELSKKEFLELIEEDE